MDTGDDFFNNLRASILFEEFDSGGLLETEEFDSTMENMQYLLKT